ncbi:MAG: acyl-CoA carboxylase subunit epsilon [Candidatus Nanopelagicales bacterium]|nr:acyl-CoA carboxylase subunit epsilon [Candidatus Nanopelagicales bacterium]
MSSEPPEDKRPVLRVITGNPSAEELAAILAIVASVVPPADAPKGLSHWNDHSRGIIRTLRPSASAWRASTMAH